MGGKLVGNGAGGGRGKALGFVQRSQLGQFGLRGVGKFGFSCAICARSLSRWLETETYSPSAIDTAPPTRPASPAVKMGPRAEVAPETPMTMAGTDTIPSLAPSTPGPQPVQATRAGTRMRLRAVSRPPALGRLNLSHRWHCVVNPHPSSGRPTVTHCSGSVGSPAP